jgi:hypothetical protein
MAKYIVVRNSDGKEDGRPGWMHREVRDHDRRYECRRAHFRRRPVGRARLCEVWSISAAVQLFRAHPAPVRN